MVLRTHLVGYLDMETHHLGFELFARSDGLQPTSDGLHPSRDGLQPNRNGLQANRNGLTREVKPLSMGTRGPDLVAQSGNREGQASNAGIFRVYTTEFPCGSAT